MQRERQGTASALARQVTSLLQRTVLNVSVTCQAIHSKNARHMLLGESIREDGFSEMLIPLLQI